MQDARRLIVNADDFGLSAGVNLGIVQAHEKGVVTSASLMVLAPAAAEAAALACKLPSLSLGLHVDIGEWCYSGGEWRAVYEWVPQHDAAALQCAVTEQLELFRALMCAEPTHLDSHQHAHLRDPLRSIMRCLAGQLRVPLRHFSSVYYCGAFYGQDGKGRSMSRRLRISFLRELVQGLQHPVTELCCHPAAIVDFESFYAEERLKELEVLCSSSVRECIQETGVTLVSFGEL